MYRTLASPMTHVISCIIIRDIYCRLCHVVMFIMVVVLIPCLVYLCIYLRHFLYGQIVCFSSCIYLVLLWVRILCSFLWFCECYCRAVIDLSCLILSVIDCVMTSRLIHTSQTTIFRHRTVSIFNWMLM